MTMVTPVPKKTNQSNSPSKLLSNEENETLFRIVGPKCQTQVSAVVQVYGTEPPNHSSWKKLHCGVATFTKDNSRRSYYIQVFDIVKEQKLLEQEMYNLFSYHISMPFFHQFEGENQMIGLNFADNQEAEAFSKVITDRLDAKQRKREERRRQQQQEINTQQPQIQVQNHQRQTSYGQQNNSHPPISSNSHISNRNNKGRKGKRANKIRKDQIGEPTNFQHLTHVGFDHDKGFSSFNVNDDLNEFFKLAGVSQRLLQDDNTRRFIYDFIDKHGGVERAAQETKVYGSIKRTPSMGEKASGQSMSESNQQKPALPSRNTTSTGTPPPPPPPRPHNNHPQAAPPPPPKEKTFPEKETSTTQPGNHSAPPPPPPPPRIPSANGAIPTPPRTAIANGVAGAPPPPPPPPMGNQPPLQLPVPTNSIQPSGVRNDLLAQIRQRPALNPVSQHKIEKPEPDSRSNLLSEIRNREYELKPVTLQEGDTSPVALPVENTMAAMLAKALEGRAKVIQDESDSEEEEDEDEDEWDDN